MAANNNKEAIILSIWIGRALRRMADLSAREGCASSSTNGTEDPLKGRTNKALCSYDEYLMPALRLAYSLVDQIICEEETDGKLPSPSVDWTDNIFVYSNSNNQVEFGCNLMNGEGRRGSLERRDSLDSLAFIDSLGLYPSDARGEDNFDEDDLLFNGILNGSNPLPKEETHRGIDETHLSIDEGCDDIRAELDRSLFNSNITTNDDDKEDMQRLYSLGVVFYVIFSGGERPTHFPIPKSADHDVERNFSIRSDTDTLPETEDLPHDLSESSKYLDAIPLNQEARIDPRGEQIVALKRIDGEFASGPFGNLTFDAMQNPNPKKKHALQQNRDISNNCSVSLPVESSLRGKGIPSPLCDLVVNMLDCTNGTLSGEDTYQNMSDVRSDLRLMLDNPNTFLRDLDVMKSATGSQFIEKTMFGRNAELSTIKDAYRGSISGERGLVTISGTSGTGKSLLANEFGKFVSSDGGIFLSGKFDQLQQGKPYSALATSFDQYCGILLHEDMTSTKEKVVSKLRSVLGRELYHLAKIIPKLASILGIELSMLSLNDDCINAQKRVQYLLCQFVEVISSSSSVPITLFLDDLQWADAASVAAMNQLLFAAAGPVLHKNFFFLGCAREKDSTTTWLPSVDILVSGGINIKLDSMDEHMLNTMVSETLCLSPRLTRTLSNIIYHKTKGNPLFVSRLMISLSNEGLLRPSLSRRRWEWDTKKIRSRSLPDDVAKFLTDSLGELCKEVRWALFVLSCFGASSENAFVESQGLFRNVLKNLEIAAAEGLVDKVGDQYRFAHDHIQEAAYNTIPPHRRSLIHFNCGLELSSLLGEDASASDLFTAVNQLNLGGPPAAQGNEQFCKAARLNLRAGKRAMEMSDYETAHSYFDSGISFLRKNHWQEHYALSLELFSLAAKCALTNGNHTGLKQLISEVMKRANFYEDKLDVLYLEMCALASSSRLAESIEQGLDILSKLGVELHGTSLEARVQETKDLLSPFIDEELLNSKQMIDPTMIMAMKFLGKLEFGMTLIMPKSVPYVTFKIIQLSLTHGMSPVSPVAFAYYGSYLAKQGNIDEGYHYVKLALSLLDKVESRENAGIVIFICTQVKTYVEPLQAALGYHHEGYIAAMTSGDSSLAVLNLIGLHTGSLYAGANLQRVQERFTDLTKLSEERKQFTVTVQSKLIQRTMSKLVGTGEEPKYCSEGQNILASNVSILRSDHYQTAYVSFIFRSYDETVENIEKYFAFQESSWGNLFYAHAVQAFYTGLIAFWVARKSKEQRWHEKGSQSKLALRRWADSSQWTFQNKWYLLEAEESFCNNDFNAAKSFYKKAITSAQHHKFVHEEALAHELSAYFYLELGERVQTMEHFMLAHEKYLEWGALAKGASLLEFVSFTQRLWNMG